MEVRNSILLIGEMPPASGGIAAVCSMILESQLLRRTYDLLIHDTARRWGYSNKDKKSLTLNGVLRRLFLLLSIFMDVIRKKPQVVHYHCVGDLSFLSDLLNIFVIKRIRRRVILHYHNDPTNETYVVFPSKSSWIRKRIFLSAIHTADLLLVSSEKYRQYLINDFGNGIEGRIKVQINSTATLPVSHAEKLSSLSEDCMKVLFIGRLSENKGFFDLITVATSCSERKLNIVFKVVGSFNSYEEEIEIKKRIDSASLTNIELLGRIEEDLKNQLLKSCHLLLFPSRFEAFPITILEASASETPAIVYATGILDELVLDGKTGYVVALGDTMGVFLRLVKLYEERSLILRLGTEARKWFEEKYSPRIFEESLKRHYESVLNQKSLVQTQ